MTKDFTRGSVMKNIVIFSIPFLFSYFLQTLYGMADLFVTGQFYSASVITAVSCGSQIMHMITVIIVGFTMGTTVLVGRAAGSDNKSEASRITGNSFSFFLILSIFISAVLMFFCNNILEVMSVPQISRPQTKLYLTICFTGIPFITVYNIFSAVFRGLGDSKTPMYFVLFTCLINIFLDYFFMGILGLHAEGAALATVISQAASVDLMIIFCLKSKKNIKIKKSDLVPDGNIVKSIARIGVPVAVQDGFIQISFLTITVIANMRGVQVAAAVGIVEKIICFLFLVPSSMLSSVSAISAQNIGACKHYRAKKTLFCGIILSASLGMFFSIILQFLSEPVLRLFTYESKVVELGTQYLKSYVFDCVFAAVHFSFSGFFCAYGYSMASFLHNIISIILVRIPGAALASRYYPENLFPMGIAAPAGSALSAVICVIIYRMLFCIKKSTFQKLNK